MKLTLDQIKAMHGKPVWLRNTFKNGYWVIVDASRNLFVGIMTIPFVTPEFDEEFAGTHMLYDFNLLEGEWEVYDEQIIGDKELNITPYSSK